MGEFGLDYDRFHFCDKETQVSTNPPSTARPRFNCSGNLYRIFASLWCWGGQLKGFELQFRLAEATGLPLFLHMREAASDFTAMIRAHRSRFSDGVVHSFTGSLQEATDLIAEGKAPPQGRWQWACMCHGRRLRLDARWVLVDTGRSVYRHQWLLAQDAGAARHGQGDPTREDHAGASILCGGSYRLCEVTGDGVKKGDTAFLLF